MWTVELHTCKGASNISGYLFHLQLAQKHKCADSVLKALFSFLGYICSRLPRFTEVYLGAGRLRNACAISDAASRSSASGGN